MSLLLLACAYAAAAAQDVKPLTFPVWPRSIEITVGAGDVAIVGSDADRLEVRVQGAVASPEGDRLVIRSSDAGGPPDRQSRAQVGLRVPPGVTITSTIRVVDGRLTLRALRGQVAADVRQGTIHATDVGGVLRLETGFGDVIVEGAQLAPGGLLRLRAFNGDVRLTLAARPENARLLALTFNGKINSNLPLNRRESFGPKFAEATFGTGDPLISIDSVTGNIAITVAASPRR